MLDNINGISNVNVSTPLQFDSFSNTYDTALSIENSKKSGDGSPPSDKLEEVIPQLIKLVEQLMDISQNAPVDDSASAGEGEGGDGVVPSAEESGSTGDSSSGSEDSNSAAGAPVEGSTNSDESMIGSGEDTSPSGQLEEIMSLLVKLVEQLMAMVQGKSADESESVSGSKDTDSKTATPTEASTKPEQSIADNGGEASSQLEEIMPLLVKLVEQLMAMVQGESADESKSASDSKDTDDSTTATPAEASTKPEQSIADNGSSQLEEIMPLLVKLVEQLMAMVQGESADESESASDSKDTDDSTTATPAEASTKPEQSIADNGSSQLEEIMPLLVKLVEQLMAMMQGESADESKSASDSGAKNSAAVTPAEGGIRPEQSNSENGHIPAPTEHLQNFDLGDKSVTVGGDGTANASEVQSTTDSLKNLYQNSDTFRNMIDSSSDSNFEVSVGKRDDNTSWGNSEGRVFMNINNVEPNNNDTFQSLLGHEFAHASIDIGHGAQMEQLESKIAAEA